MFPTTQLPSFGNQEMAVAPPLRLLYLQILDRAGAVHGNSPPSVPGQGNG